MNYLESMILLLETCAKITEKLVNEWFYTQTHNFRILARLVHPFKLYLTQMKSAGAGTAKKEEGASAEGVWERGKPATWISFSNTGKFFFFQWPQIPQPQINYLVF